MSIGTWFDILFDGMEHGIDWLMAIDIGGISLGDYVIVIFINRLADYVVFECSEYRFNYGTANDEPSEQGREEG